MKRSFNVILPLFLIFFLGILFQKKHINEFPTHTHAWAQADRYALARGFDNNNLNFFMPETFVLNHQFPDTWNTPSNQSITAVDFPIHDYIPAIFMKISGDSSPWIFRTYILLYSFLGLFYLFKLTKLLSKDVFKALFITAFAATSPIFVYYQAGFLPTIPSLANAIIGICFYIKFIRSHKNSDFNLSLLFLTLAALSRMTFLIPLIAVLGVELISVIKKESKFVAKVIPILLSAILISAFFFYNVYLRNTYGSIFLNHIVPAHSVDEALEILKQVKETWIMHYFSIIHYIILSVVLVVALCTIVVKKNVLTKELKKILLLISIIFVGCILFFFLMLKQFSAHDYYFLDTFYLPILLLLIFALSIIPPFKSKWKNTSVVVILLILIISLVSNTIYSERKSKSIGNLDRISATVKNFDGAENFLDSLSIPVDAKILVIDACAPNIPFLLMNRKGYITLSTERDIIANALSWKYDYIIMQNDFFLSDIYASFPEIINKTHVLSSNGRISICKLNKVEKIQTLEEYLGLKHRVPVNQDFMDFENDSKRFWKNINATSAVHFAGKRSGVIDAGTTYGLTYLSNYLPAITEKRTILFFESYFMREVNADFEIVVSINEGGKNIYYKTYNLKSILKSTNKWEKVNLIFDLPKVDGDAYDIAVFTWNTGKSKVYIDDFGFKIY